MTMDEFVEAERIAELMRINTVLCAKLNNVLLDELAKETHVAHEIQIINFYKSVIGEEFRLRANDLLKELNKI